MGRIWLSAFIILGLFTACKKTPDYVIPHEEMVDLLVDVHKAEAVVLNQRNIYYNDSLKKAVKQSVFAKHGVTSAQVDTSLVWYGHHLEEYMEIYDEVIARLQEEANATLENKKSVMTIDSTDVWIAPQRIRINNNIPSNSLVFDFDQDDTWKKGDNYQLSAKILNISQNKKNILKAAIMAEYDDSTHEYRTSSQSSEGWFRMRFVTDSTKMPIKISGYILFESDEKETMFLDSISLIRTRLNKSLYNRNGHQKY